MIAINLARKDPRVPANESTQRSIPRVFIQRQLPLSHRRVNETVNREMKSASFRVDIYIRGIGSLNFRKGNETIKIEIYGDSTGYQGEERGGDRERDLRDSDDTVREQTRKRRGTLFPHVRETRGGGRGGGSSSISVDRLVGSITRRPLPIVR